MAVVLSCL